MERVKGGDAAGKSESGADLTDKIRPAPLSQQVAESDEPDLSPQDASQLLWSTGVLYAPIPNGFYSVIPVSIYENLTFMSFFSFLGIM
jgi:hypothetical protein